MINRFIKVMGNLIAFAFLIVLPIGSRRRNPSMTFFLAMIAGFFSAKSDQPLLAEAKRAAWM